MKTSQETCAALVFGSSARGERDGPCKEPPVWRMTLKGLTTLTFNVCETHYDKARRALESDPREWSATPINRRKEPCECSKK